jgi:transcriptional regulator with XRE-family HTH domain
MIDEKIKHILVTKNLSPSRFAEEIGVQRSSISHILSGRNKPSFDIIQKILRRFPDLGMEWILTEDNNSMSATTNKTPEPMATPMKVGQPANIPNRHIEKGNSGISTLIESTPAKEIEKILIFYKDKTFTEYKPS